MSPTLDAFVRSWPFDPWLVLALGLTGALYLRGWLLLHARDAQRWHAGQPAAFLGGLAALFLALASPIEPFADLLLQVHMLQHLLLMMVAPPLLWLGAPLLPLMRGLPAPIRVYWAAPLFRWPWLRRLLRRWTHPAFALPLFVATTWLWHVPAVYELALTSSAWHYLQHGCFLATALLFWYGVVRPYPSRPHWSVWLLLPCLVLADVQNTILAAVLTFADRVLYPHYVQVPRLAGISALDDQAAAGALMWVPGSAAFLLPMFWIGLGLLYGRPANRQARNQTVKASSPVRRMGRISLPLVGSTNDSRLGSGFDLLRLPLLGRFLKWRHARLSLQLVTAALAAAIIADGVWGPAIGPMNLAGVLPWTFCCRAHWRAAG
jgi:cytochrome c oxidase assembly factor CtaG